MKQKKIDNLVIFTFSVIFLEIIFWVSIIITRSSNILSYYVSDYHNTSMDYFNMLANLSDLDPYKYNANYPALCFLILRFFYHAVPLDVNCEDGFFLRNYMPAQLIYILSCTLLILLFYEGIKKYFDNENKINLLFSISILLSGPVIFLFERGNLLFISVVSLLFFFTFYDSKKKGERYFSYVMLSIAAAIKIYPAIFGLLLFKKKRYKEIPLLVLIGLVFFFVPFFFFDGMESIKIMIDGILESSDNSVALGFGYNFSFVNFMQIIAALFHKTINTSSMFYKLIPMILAFCIFTLSKEEWKQFLGLTLFCIWVPTFSYTYTLVLFVFPLLAFFKNNKSDSFGSIYTIFFVIILAPLNLPLINRINYIDGNYVKFPVSGSTLLINISIMAIAMFILIDIIIKKRKDLANAKRKK